MHRGTLPLHTELPVEIAYYCYLHNDIYKYGRNMKALIIIACVIVYLVMWVVTGVFCYRQKELGGLTDAAGIGFFWPVALPFAIVMVFIYRISKRLDRKEEKK